MDWYFSVLRKYAVFEGRARRKEYWMFMLFNALFISLVTILDLVLLHREGVGLGILSILYSLAMIVPNISVTVRRLHDIDKSGWWYFISLVPLIGGIWLFILLCTNGTYGVNRYGFNPKEMYNQ